jgi:hypothetical protein
MIEPQVASLHIRYGRRAANNISTPELRHIWQPWFMLKLMNISTPSITSLVQQ